MTSKEQKGRIIGWILSFLGILIAVALAIGLNLALYMAFPNPLIGLAFMALILITVLIVYFILLSLISSKFGIYLPVRNPFRRKKEEQPEVTPPPAGGELMEGGTMSSEASISHPSFKREEPKIATARVSSVHFKYITRLEGKYPDVYVGVVEDPETGGVRYVAIEPEMSEKEIEAYKRVVGFLEEELEIDVESLRSREEARRYVKNKISEIIKKHRIMVPRSSLNKFMYYFERDFLGLGKIEPLMHDPMIEDISCDGVGIPVYIWHREFESIPTNIVFESEKELDSFIVRLAHLSGRHISLANPMVDATLPDGSRIQLTLGKEVTQKGSTFTIRKFRVDPLTVTDLLKYKTMSPELAAYFWYAIEKRFSILIAGGTASGKTTTLNVLSMFILPDLKIVSIEDTRELNLPHKNWIPSVTRTAFGETEIGEITLFDLLKASLRQRPDIIIVGEVRGEEAYTLLQAAATGHGGLSTIHADSVKATIERLSTPPMNVPKPLIASALHIIAMQLKLRIGNRSVRKITHVAEIVRYDHGIDDIVLNDVFKWDPTTDTHRFLGKSNIFKLIRERYGEREEEIRRAIEMRKTVLEWMVQKDIRNYREVSKVIREFYTDPEGIYTRARGELSIEKKV